MANDYVQNLNALLARIVPDTPRGTVIEVKPFFGGAAGYLDGQIFISLTKVGLALKLPDEDIRKLIESGDATEMRYFPKAPVKKQYALMADGYIAGSKPIKPWIEKSIRLVASPDGHG